MSIFSRCVVPYGGLVRGRLAAGETVIVNGATGAYGTAAVLVALAMGAGMVTAVPGAMEAAQMATSLECVVVRPNQRYARAAAADLTA